MDKDKDMVNHPPHYTSHPSGVECIQITEHMNFNIGNAVKYLWRSGEKGSRLEDLKKARWYVEREIHRLEGKAEEPLEAVERKKEGQLLSYKIARVAHAVNQAYRVAIGETPGYAWADLLVDDILNLAKAVERQIHHRFNPQESHEVWMTEKRTNGWRYGPVEDAEAKTHPCLVPFDKLPAYQKAKDYIFTTLVKELSE